MKGELEPPARVNLRDPSGRECSTKNILEDKPSVGSILPGSFCRRLENAVLMPNKSMFVKVNLQLYTIHDTLVKVCM